MTLSFFAKGQDAGEGLNQDEQLARHSLGLAIAHAQSFEGRDENNDRKTLALSCWSLDYNYHINSTWAVGLHTDFILQKFRIEESDEAEFAERSYPIAPAVVGMYSISPRWEFQLGAGMEFAKEEDVLLIRAGVEYGVELPKEWEVFGSLCYDIKWDTYRTITLGIGLARRLGH